MTISTIREKAQAYTLAEEIINARVNDRKRFTDRFPLDKLQSLTIDEYVAGNGPDTFCYWLEFKKIGAGIGGGNATKFGIYRPNKTTDDTFAIGYGTNRTILSREQANEYFNELKSKLLKAIECAKSDRVEMIKDIEVPIWNMVLLKILTLYFPEKFLPINAPQVLIKCARALQIENLELKSDNAILINHSCKKELSHNEAFSDWADEKIGMFMWESFQDAENKQENQGPQYWLYAPGENARLWEEFYNSGMMGLGWDKLGDLRQYETKDDIRLALVDLFGGDGSKKNDVGALYDFLYSVRIGDYIIVKKGVNELVGYGVVSSEYNYDPSRSEYFHVRQVDWKKRGNWPLDFRLVLKTLTDITDYPTEHPEFKHYHERLMAIMNEGFSNFNNSTVAVSMNYPLNSIFYGPPGTGKTYHTVQRAAEIIEGRTITSHSEALAIFKQNLHDRIEFITFHQNYSYEDFIQGLRPDTRDENDQLLFTKSDGVFKKIADRALKNLNESKKQPTEISKEKDFEQALQDFIEQLNENDGIFKITENCRISGITDTAFRYGGENWSQQAQGRLMKFNDLRSFFKQNVQTRKDIRQLTDVSALAVQHATYFFGVYQEILKYLKPGASAPSIDLERKNYVIVIDEINRANISRVFGELITLIESDKRSDGAIPLEVKLPSGDMFMIPSNLYIIGTMNTADKSIALLDIALRRRFEFEAMYPKYELDGKPLENAEILRKINEQIIKTKGHDFQIGHAYFMAKNESLQQRMNNKVIPLLLEYYMNDEKEVKSLLQSAGLQVEEKSWPLRITSINA